MTNGEFDAANSAYRLVTPGHETLAEMIVTATQLFQRPTEPGTGLDPGTDWLGIPGFEQLLHAWVGHPSPYDFRALRRLAEREVERGGVDLGGVSTRRYLLVVSPEDAARITKAGLPSPSSVAITFPSQPRLDLWVDTEGRIVRFRYEAMQGDLPLVSVTDFTDFGGDIVVELPEPSRVTSLGS